MRVILWNQQGKFGDDRGDRSDHDRPNRTMFYPGDNDRRCRLDRPQIFPHCFHKIAQIACELFLAKGANRAIRCNYGKQARRC